MSMTTKNDNELYKNEDIKVAITNGMNTKIKDKLNNHWYKNEHNNLLDNIEITNSELLLSTITAEGRLSNIKFHEEDVIKNMKLSNNIIKIGCNYNEYIDELYVQLTTKVKTSNRGRKPKIKVKPMRKIQGTGHYFNSQITFTFLNNLETKKMYHIKLFRNGSIQIPSVTDESLLSINKEITELIEYISQVDGIKEDNDKDIEQLYLISIMNNYKTFLNFNNKKVNVLQNEDILLDGEMEKMNLKDDLKDDLKYELKDKVEEKVEEKIMIPNTEESLKYLIDLYKLEKLLLMYKDNPDNKLNYTIYNITYLPEKYTALTIKFITPVEITNENVLKYKKRINTKKIKKTTIKIFGSCKLNIDGSPSRGVSEVIITDLLNIFNEYKNELFY